MKSYFITIIFCCIFSAVFAQPTGDIQKDTAQANLLFSEARTKLENPSKVVEEQLNEALELYQFHKNYEKEIETYSCLAYSHRRNDSLKTFYLKQAFDLANMHFDSTHVSLAITYYTLQDQYHLQNTALSIKYGLKFLEMNSYLKEEYIFSTILLFFDYLDSDNMAAFEALLQKIETEIKDSQSPLFLQTLLYQGKMLFAMYFEYNYEKAILFGKQCIVSNEETNVLPLNHLGMIYMRIALSYSDLENFEKAEKWMFEALEITNFDSDDYNLGTYYFEIGLIYSRFRRFEEAILFLDKTEKIYKLDTTENRNDLFLLYLEKAEMFYNSDQITKAKETLVIAEKYHKNYHTHYLHTFISLELNEVDTALYYIQNAINEVFDGFQNDDYTKNPDKYLKTADGAFAGYILYGKGGALVDKAIEVRSKHLLRLGIETYNLSIHYYDLLMQDMYGYERSKIFFNERVSQTFSGLIQARHILASIEPTSETKEGLFAAMQREKSALLLKTLNPKSFPEEVIKEEERLTNQKNQIEQKLLITDSTAFYQKKMLAIDQEIEVFADAIKKQYPQSALMLDNISYPTLSTVQKGLSKDCIIVEYSFGYNYVIITTLSDSSYTYKQVVFESDFKSKIEQLSKLLKSPFIIQNKKRDEFIDISHELYNILVKPIEAEIKPYSKIIFIPTEEINYLPFEVLLRTDEKKPFHKLDFLIKDFSINYQYSVAIYHQLKQKTAIEDKSFLGFAPIFENGQTIDYAARTADFIVDSLLRSVDDNRFINLPNSKIEIETIAQIIKNNNGKTTVLLEETATKNILREELKSKSYQFIHIATHGIVNFQTPKLSALACYDTTKNVEKALLFANEVQMQDIQADLVVLSSCESGIGKLVEGEGLIALNRSFIASGANNVIFSLWKVNDELTAELMIDFYKFYFQNQSYTEALRQAKLKMLQDPIRANPRYWAAFVLIGE